MKIFVRLAVVGVNTIDGKMQEGIDGNDMPIGKDIGRHSIKIRGISANGNTLALQVSITGSNPVSSTKL